MRAREFLEKSGASIADEESAAKAKKGKAEALALARKAKRLVVSKGTRLTELDMKTRPSDGQILDLLLGPTGNLRAPTIKVGDTLYVGFPKEGFADLGS
ncbi:MAG: ArsC family (seleno)protein [Acidobacteriota bacterium]